MSNSLIQIQQIYGIRQNVANNLDFSDDTSIVYLAGSYCIVYSLENKKQKFLQIADKHKQISAVDVSPNKRYLALSEKGDNSDQACIIIYDLTILRKRKSINTHECHVEDYISLNFTADSKSLISLSLKPEYIVTYWSWEKAKVLATLKLSSFESTMIYANPFDINHLSCIGDGIVKMYRYTDSSLRAISGPKLDVEISCMCWISDEVVVMATKDGHIVICNETMQEIDVKSLIPELSTPTLKEEDEMKNFSVQQKSSFQMNKIIVWKKGFIISTNIGLVLVFDEIDSKFKLTKIIKLPVQGLETENWSWQNITNICINISSSLLACLTSKMLIYTITLNTSSSSRCEEMFFELCTEGFNGGEVTGVDVCIKKPIFATSSLDKHIRIYNYETGALELEKEFADETFSVALHPNGLHILAGFNDKLRFMNIHADDIRMTKEFPIRSCKVCCFSHGGQFIAAVNYTVIMIYSSLTYELIATLKGHSGKIKHIVFTNDDLRIYSCGQDGAFYEWDVLSGRRISENILKFCSYEGMVVDSNMKSVMLVGSDNKIKTITGSEVSESMDVDAGGWMVGSSMWMMLASPTGSIRTSKRAFTSEWMETYAHSALINRMIASFDNQWLISVSVDCSVIVWKVQDLKDSRDSGREIQSIKDVSLRDIISDDVLITKADIEEKRSIIVELRMRLEEQRLDFDNEMRIRDATYASKLQQLTEAFLTELEQVKTENMRLDELKSNQEIENNDLIKDINEKHTKELHDLEATNNQKLMIEYEKYQDLEARSQRIQEEGIAMQKEADLRKLASEQEMMHKHQLEIQALQRTIKQLQSEKGDSEAHSSEMTKQVEEDADWELLQQKNKYEQQLQAQAEASTKLKNELSMMKKRLISLNKDVSDGKEEMDKLNTDASKLRNSVANLEKDILGYKREIQERDETIQDKERRIFELKKKNQELDKFKFVLDYKNKDLRKQIEPRELDIKTMKLQIQEMDVELERYRSENQQLELNLEEMRTKLKSQEKEMQTEKLKARSTEVKLDRLLTDVHNCTSYIQDPPILKQQVLTLYQKHLQNNNKEDVSMDKRREDDWARQREHLEKSVSTLASKQRKDSQIHRAENLRIMQDNVTLIDEVNSLRTELKLARSKMHDLEMKLKVAEKQMPRSVSLSHMANSRSNSLIGQEVDDQIGIEIREKEKLEELQRQMEDARMRPSSNPRLTPIHAA